MLVAVEVKTRDICAAVHGAVAKFDDFLPAADFFPDVFFRIKGFAALVYIGQLDRIAQTDGAAVGFFLTGDHAEQGGFTGTVGADDADDATRRQTETHTIDQQAVAVTLGDVIGFDNDIAEARSRRDEQFHFPLFFLDLLSQQLFIGGDTCLPLGMTSFGRHANPLQLALQGFLAGAFLLFILAQAFLLLFQPGGIVAFPGNPVATVQFQNPTGNVVQEVTIMGNGDNGTSVALKMVFQPCHGFGIEVVGRFVQQQDIRFFQQQATQRDAAFFAAGQYVDHGLSGRTAQRIHGLFEAAVEVPGVEMIEFFLHFALPRNEIVHFIIGHRLGELHVDVVEFVDQINGFLNAFLDDLANGFTRLQFRLLLEISDRVTGGEDGFALEILVDTGQNAQQGAFTGAVQAQYADFGAIKIG